MRPLPTEIYNELVDGLTLLVNARLAFGPRTEQALDETLQAWEIVLAGRCQWDEKDNGRVIAAFIEMSGKLDKFPAPKTLFEFLPPRPLPPPLPKPKAVPCPPEIAQLLNNINKKLITSKEKP